MNINMEVIDSSKLDYYIDDGSEIPFTVCVPLGMAVTRRQQAFLERYYDRVEDRKGRETYYCNIINAWKCKSMGYNSITFGNGKKEYISGYKFTKKNGKYVLYPCFRSGRGMDAVSLVAKVRLLAAKTKQTIAR